MTGSMVLYKKANMTNFYSELILHQVASFHLLTSHKQDIFHNVTEVCGLNHAGKPF